MPFTTKQLEEALTAKLMLNFSKTPEEATQQEYTLLYGITDLITQF